MEELSVKEMLSRFQASILTRMDLDGEQIVDITDKYVYISLNNAEFGFGTRDSIKHLAKLVDNPLYTCFDMKGPSYAIMDIPDLVIDNESLVRSIRQLFNKLYKEFRVTINKHCCRRKHHYNEYCVTGYNYGDLDNFIADLDKLDNERISENIKTKLIGEYKSRSLNIEDVRLEFKEVMKMIEEQWKE